MLFRDLVPVAGGDPCELTLSERRVLGGLAQEALELMSQGVTVTRPENKIVIDRQ